MVEVDTLETTHNFTIFSLGLLVFNIWRNHHTKSTISPMLCLTRDIWILAYYSAASPLLLSVECQKVMIEVKLVFARRILHQMAGTRFEENQFPRDVAV